SIFNRWLHHDARTRRIRSFPTRRSSDLRRKSRKIRIGPVEVGGDAPIRVQSMTTTKTADVNATLQQIASLVAAGVDIVRVAVPRSEEHTSELQSRSDIVCRLLLEKKISF